jgi:predicted enzyme related to lactoylglutathione lyase
MNKVVHFEIPYENEERAMKFYQNVFGWQIMKMPDMEYHMVTTVESDPETMRPKTPGAINGGMLRKDATLPHPLVIVDVQDANSHVEKIKASGGKVVMPVIPIGEFGFYARVSDSEGNIIGIWQEMKK